MDQQAARQFRTDFIRSAAHIWQADHLADARLLQSSFSDLRRAKQPKAIQTLERDFDDTLAFFDVQEAAAARGEVWPARFLRTTSPLERMFREFRRRFRNALAFHSQNGRWLSGTGGHADLETGTEPGYAVCRCPNIRSNLHNKKLEPATGLVEYLGGGLSIHRLHSLNQRTWPGQSVS